jgi:hypothetical protein
MRFDFWNEKSGKTTGIAPSSQVQAGRNKAPAILQ